MDACNFPELLALDLESAESVFASKRMTAGAPRPMDVILESNSIQDLTDTKLHSNRDAFFASPRNFLPPRASSHSRSQADAMETVGSTRRHGRPEFSESSESSRQAPSPSTSFDDQPPQPTKTATAGPESGPGTIFVVTRSKQASAVPRYAAPATGDTSGWDTDSGDSFELPAISLSRGGSVHQRKPQQQHEQQKQQKQERGKQEQKQQQQQQHQKDKESNLSTGKTASLDETNHCLFPPGPGDRSVRDSRESYSSIYDSYDYTDELDDSASTSSFDISIRTSGRGRQQSVVTTATSVTSGCRFSSQSRTLSAMGPSSPVAPQRESVASCDRHVEFNLDNDIISDSACSQDVSVAPDSKRSSRASQKSGSKSGESVSAEHVPKKAGKARLSVQRRSKRLSSRDSVPLSSWLNFDDEDDEEAEGPGWRGSSGPQWAHLFKDDSSVGGAFRSGSFFIAPDSVPERPKTSQGLAGKKTPDFTPMADRSNNMRRSQVAVKSATPAPSVPVPQRYSSLKRPSIPDTFDRAALLSRQFEQFESEPCLPHQLRRCPSFGAASLSGTAAVKAELSHVRRDVAAAAERPVSPMMAAVAHTSAVDGRDGEEAPIFLQKTVYRRSIPEPLLLAADTGFSSSAKAVRGQDWCTMSMHPVSNGSHAAHQNGHGRSTHTSPVEPHLMVSQFDDDSEVEQDEKPVENDADLFVDFEGAYNCEDGEDKSMQAATTPFMKQPPRSLRSKRSFASLREHANDAHTAFATLQVSAHHADIAEETSSHLQCWIEHASRSQQELGQRPCTDEYTFDRHAFSRHEREVFYEEDEADEARPNQLTGPAHLNGDSELATASDIDPLQESLHKSQPIPYGAFQPGLVGIPLPREVVDTLRVSVSCFPETMLSLSSFSVQTIRSYSRKVRRCSQSDADSTYRLIMSPTSPTGLPPSPTSVTPFVPPLLPPSPTRTSFNGGYLDMGAGVARSMTGSTAASHSSRQFWKLPKKLAHYRAASSANSMVGSRSASNGSGSYTTGPPTPRHSSGRRGSRPDESVSSAAEDEQGKASGACFKRIFPTGSDYLCDALYAHIIAFNYVSLLCPPPSAAVAAGVRPSTANATGDDCRPVTAAHTMTTSASTATLFESEQQQRRQTIRIYAGSDVPLPSLSHFLSSDSLSPPATRGGPVMMMENEMLPLSPSSTPPPSRGRGSGNDDDNRLISRKAAQLLGISETLEPDSHKPVAVRNSELSGNALSRRYNSLLRRGLRMGTGPAVSESGGGQDGATTAPKTTKKGLPSSKTAPSLTRTSKPLPEAKSGDAEVEMANPSACVPVGLTPAAAPTAAAATADASMRDLHAGLHACISQLVATLKLTTGQLGNTLLSADAARDIDPLFLRTLCELVRSQEEQF